MATRLNDLKISCATYLPSPKLSRLSQNARGGLDANGLMYIASGAQKTSSPTLCNSLFIFSFQFYLFLIFSLS